MDESLAKENFLVMEVDANGKPSSSEEASKTNSQTTIKLDDLTLNGESNGTIESISTPVKNKDLETEDVQVLSVKMVSPHSSFKRIPSPPRTPTSAKRRKLSQQEIENREKARLERAAKLLAQQKEREEAAERKRIEKEKRDEEKRLKEQKRLEEEAARKRKLEEEKEEREKRKKQKEEEIQRRKDDAEKKRLELEKQKQLRKEEEQKRKEEIERKRKEEEEKKEQKRRAEEEKEALKKRQSEQFINFFQKIEKPKTPQTLPQVPNSRFKPFEIKEGMILAPIHVRAPFTQKEHDEFTLDTFIEKSDYLEKCKKNGFRTKRKVNPLKAKFYQIEKMPPSYTKRPPYYGTFRKRSQHVQPRRPFSTTEPTLNYEVDSDSEWEDEPSDAEECKSDEEDNDDISEEEDDGFFVGHGYLSPDEEGSDGDEKVVEDSEERKKCLAEKAKAFEEQQERRKKRKLTKIKLRAAIYGPKWEVPIQDEEELANPFFKFLMRGIVFDYTKLRLDELDRN